MKTIGPYGATCEVGLKCCVFLQGNSVCLLATPAWFAYYGKLVFQTCCESSLFSFKLSKFLGIFSGIRKLRAFERNQCFWNSCFMPWRPIV